MHITWLNLQYGGFTFLLISNNDVIRTRIDQNRFKWAKLGHKTFEMISYSESQFHSALLTSSYVSQFERLYINVNFHKIIDPTTLEVSFPSIIEEKTASNFRFSERLVLMLGFHLISSNILELIFQLLLYYWIYYSAIFLSSSQEGEHVTGSFDLLYIVGFEPVH